jgi:hypothetical protein
MALHNLNDEIMQVKMTNFWVPKRRDPGEATLRVTPPALLC